MSKYQEWKQAMKSPPPERLAKVEYQSHFFQMLGISFVCVILIAKGLWYVIFAFIFGLGISYSQGMSAYIKYNNIMALINPEHPKEYYKDPSPTRRRGKIITHVYGESSKWFSIFVSIILSLVILGTDYSRLIISLIYPITIIINYIVIYYFMIYQVAYYQYKGEMKIK